MAWIGAGLEPRTTRLVLATNRMSGHQVIGQSIHNMRKQRHPIFAPTSEDQLCWLKDTDDHLRDWSFTRVHVESYCSKRFFIRGLPEKEDEDLYDVVMKLAKALSVTINLREVRSAFRIPLFTEQCKPIMVKIEYKGTKELLLRRRMMLIPCETIIDEAEGSCYIDDLPPYVAVKLILTGSSASNVICSDLIRNEKDGDFTDNDTSSSVESDDALGEVDIKPLGIGRRGRYRKGHHPVQVVKISGSSTSGGGSPDRPRSQPSFPPFPCLRTSRRTSLPGSFTFQGKNLPDDPPSTSD